VVTLGGLFLSFASMTLVHDGRYEAAVWVIFAAAFVDVIDGTIARGLGSISPLGQQLDSLADLVAAGVAPAYLVYQVYFEEWGFAGLVVAYAWVALVALRLARFNTSAHADPLWFCGVPCPIAATVVAQYLLFSRATFGHDGYALVSAALIAVLGALMLSNVPYWKSTTLLPHHFAHHAFGAGTAATLLLTIPFPNQALFVGLSTSIVAAVIFHLVRRHPADRLLAQRAPAHASSRGSAAA
jgi:CDP-diacylglycerol--serine O-phosphatidyltransferase